MSLLLCGSKKLVNTALQFYIASVTDVLKSHIFKISISECVQNASYIMMTAASFLVFSRVLYSHTLFIMDFYLEFNIIISLYNE